MEWYFLYPIIIVAGLFTGFINTLAGAGSVLALIALSLAGLPINIANGTNRVAILLQNSVATYGFKRQGKLNVKQGLKLAVPVACGAVIGSLLACYITPGDLRIVIGIIMVIILISLFANQKRWVQGKAADSMVVAKMKIRHIIAYFLIGIYGGFVQVGIGVFLLTGLVMLSGFDLIKGNAVKVMIVFFMTIIALAIFAFQGQVRWDIGLIMACGNMAGAWIAAKEASKRGAGFVRWLMICIVAFAAVYYLGIFKLIF
jgi:uncharacterized protein